MVSQPKIKIQNKRDGYARIDCLDLRGMYRLIIAVHGDNGRVFYTTRLFCILVFGCEFLGFEIRRTRTSL